LQDDPDPEQIPVESSQKRRRRTQPTCFGTMKRKIPQFSCTFAHGNFERCELLAGSEEKQPFNFIISIAMEIVYLFNFAAFANVVEWVRGEENFRKITGPVK
jgi:hypothetical protein